MKEGTIGRSRVLMHTPGQAAVKPDGAPNALYSKQLLPIAATAGTSHNVRHPSFSTISPSLRPSVKVQWMLSRGDAEGQFQSFNGRK